ncbi:MAG: putative Ig domain-containing protein [Candidatus Solibacter sp.]
MRGLSIRILLLAAAAVSAAWGQVSPGVTGLQASYTGQPPDNVTGITAGAPLEGGFTLYVNGIFHPANFVSLQWLNIGTNVTTTFPAANATVTPTQISVTIPDALFASYVPSPVPVKITVTETGGSSFAFFAINPPVRMVQPFLPAGTLGVPYAAQYYTGGTAPFDAFNDIGAASMGLNGSPANISGTPTSTGTFAASAVATDYWGSSDQTAAMLEIVEVPTITLVTPGSSGTGAGDLTITVNGTHFVDRVIFGEGQEVLPGSVVQWKSNGVRTDLATTFVNAGQLTAVIPSDLLASPASAGIAVQQPSPASSNALPFAVIAPTISTILPTGVLAGSNTTTLTVNGANFTTHGSAVPTVTLNGIALSTTFVNSGQVTAIIPSSLLISSLLTPTVTLGSSQNPSAPGQSVTITATVATPTTGTPTGTVTFKDGGVTLASNVALSGGGKATFSSSALAAGTHSLTAIYSGNASFSPNTSAVFSHVVLAANTGMVLTSSRSVPSVGTSVTYRVTLVNPVSPPQGSVTISDNSSTVCTIASVIPGATSSTGTCVVTYDNSNAQHGPGLHDLTAGYTPSNANWTSTTANLSVTVVNASATPGTPGSSNGTNFDYGFATTLTSTVSPVPANPVFGPVDFFDGTLLIATAIPNSATGVATTAGVLLTAGTHVITAQYAGDSFYGTSNLSAGLTVTVNPSAAKPYVVQVSNPGGTVTNTVPFFLLPPVLSTISPLTVPVGSAAFTLTASGANFLPTSQIVFNGTALTTTLSTSLTATVSAGLLGSAGIFPVMVSNGPGAVSGAVSFTVASPTLATISPILVSQGSATFTLTVTGTNFVPGSQVLMDGAPLATTFVNANSLTAMVSNTSVSVPKLATIAVANPGQTGNVTGTLPLTVVGTLAIATTSLPSGIAGSVYTTTLLARGGVLPYTWTASGYPAALFLNPGTGVLSGTLLAGGTYLVNVTVQDATKAVVTAQFSLLVSPPPVTISTSAGLPGGTVGAAYTGSILASGGAGPYTFSVTGGSLPDGLTLAPAGAISGTPKTAGTFSFAVTAKDANGETGSGSFSIRVTPAPLTVTGPPSNPPVVAGTPATLTFTGGGGTPPYRFTPCSAPPPGLTFSSGVLTGTPTTAGTFPFCVTIGDAADVTATKTISIVIVEAPVKLTLAGGTLPDGKVGVAYSGQITAAGGSSPYTYAGTGLPDGLTMSAAGAISGTPGTDGPFSFSVTVTDSKGATATGTFRITVAPADITIITASLPDGTVGAVYSVTLSASGGNKAYTWTVTGLPEGLTATAAGVVSGTPKTSGKSTVSVSVQDSTGSASVRRTTLSLTILPAALTITTTPPPNGVAGTTYSVAVTVTGGTGPFTYSATGLPAGLSISAAGVISGTPTTPGTSTVVVTVKDSAGATATNSFTITVGLPSTPPLNFSGVGDTAGPLQQPRVQVSLGSTFPVDVVVTLTLTFAPDSGADDPSIQFSGGGRTARITIPAGSTNGATDVGFQTGSVAGVITITAQMQASGQDITPSPAPRRTVRIAAAAPVIVTGSLTAVRNASGFTVTLNGYVTDREMTQAIFVFTPAAGSNLQTSTLTVAIDALFSQYFSGSGSVATGSQFTFTQPFTVTGSTQAIASVTVTLVNRIGQSAAVTGTLN